MWCGVWCGVCWHLCYVCGHVSWFTVGRCVGFLYADVRSLYMLTCLGLCVALSYVSVASMSCLPHPSVCLPVGYVWYRYGAAHNRLPYTVLHITVLIYGAVHNRLPYTVLHITVSNISMHVIECM